MRMKYLIVVVVLLMFTATAAVAQNIAFKKPSVKDIIPYGKKMPFPELTKHPGQFLPGIAKSRLNKSMPGLNYFNANEIKKDPAGFKQKLKDIRNGYIPDKHSQETNGTAADVIYGDCNYVNFHLTRDINALAESYPFNDREFYPFSDASYAVLNGVIYFAANDGIHGIELWRSDGTAAGTYLVKDIEPGEASSFIYTPNINAINGKLYFTSFTSAKGLEPWVSDGTESGTQLLKDINPGVYWSWATEFVGMGKTVYFVTDGDFSVDGALWATDGTSAGTKVIKKPGDEGNGGQWITQLTVVKDLLFFSFINYNSFSWELWRSDGSEKGTYQVGNNAYFIYAPAQLTSYNNKLYFSADDGTGRKLWVSDGTNDGTRLARGNHQILIDADLLSITFPILNNVLFIPGSYPGYDNGLFKYNAFDNDGLVPVKDLAFGKNPKFIVPSEMEVVDNTLYFKVVNDKGAPHDELWSSKGHARNTKPVKEFLPGETIYSLCKENSILYFVKYDAVDGVELWKTNGTDAGTSIVSDIFKGSTSSYPAYLTAFKGKLFFSAVNDKKGDELFMTNNDGSGTSLVKDINTTATSGSFPSGLTVLGKSVLFAAQENVHGYELYKSDGTKDGTVLLKDIVPGEAGSFPYAFEAKNNAVYFVAYTKDNLGTAVYKASGNNIQKISPDYDFNYYITTIKIADNGTVFYRLLNFYTFTYDLWSSDGTATGSTLLTSALYADEYLNVAGNTAFFVAGDNVNGYELWKSDGSPGGTGLVKDIYPGKTEGIPNSGTAGGMFVYKNEVYFGAYDGKSDYYSFWKSDGSKAGTVKLKNVDPWWSFDASSTAEFFCISNGILYFSGVDHYSGRGSELWRTDGTPAGTKVVKDPNPITGDLLPYAHNLVDVNGTLFFAADDGVHGEELWKSDGTGNGTKMIKNIINGPMGTPMTNFISCAGKLFFVNHYRYNSLWSSDGTAQGTRAVFDPDISGLTISGMAAASDKLFVAGSTYKYGYELYMGKVDKQLEKFTAAETDESAVKTATFNARLYPNPAGSSAALQITGSTKNVAISITDMNGRKLWQSAYYNPALINLPIKKFIPGTYLVTVTSGREQKMIKLVKQ